MSRARPERGAAAVEMAIVLPILLMVIGGLVDFGRAYYASVVAANGAREGARMVAMGYTTGEANTRVAAAMVLPGSLGHSSAYVSCPNPNEIATATVTVTQFDWLMLDVVPGFFGGSIPVPTISSTGSMRCNG